MNILLLGTGGREHALAYKIAQSPILNKLFIAPGNPGTAQYGTNIPIAATDFFALKNLCSKEDISLIVCGPEDPLVKGVYDYFTEINIPVVGPSQFAAQLEGSKSFAKKFMFRNNIPTAAYHEYDETNITLGLHYIENNKGPFVLKADGLAAGKGVLIIEDKEEAKNELKNMIELKKFGKASSKVVLEEFLSGIEFSVFAITDGVDYILLPNAKDYKRIGEGDKGLNTGGMGAVSPVPFVTDELMNLVEKTIVKPTIDGFKKESIIYKGFVYFGLILTEQGPKVIEYNCRMGDPETEVVMPRIESDIVPVFSSLFNGTLKQQKVIQKPSSAVTIILASGGYPESFEKDFEITVHYHDNQSLIFHAGTKEEDGKLKTSGGRVMAITSLAPNIQQAAQLSIQQANEISFKNKYFRKDIGYEFLNN